MLGWVHILRTMVSEAQRLHAALVSALPGYVMAALTERGYPLNRPTAEAIEGATEFLDRELGVELEKAYRDQRRSPLELFRAALGIVALTLTDAGVSRTGTAPPAMEGDTYGLAPGSSSALGPEAHAAHVAWGAAKAAAFVGDRSAAPAKPVVLLLAADRDDREAIAPLLESPGVACVAVRNPAAVADTIESGSVLVAVVDLAHRSSRDAITRLTRAGIATIVYGDAIDDLTETGLRAQGVRSLVDRHAFAADPARFLPRII
jgi:hypothetical protein